MNQMKHVRRQRAALGILTAPMAALALGCSSDHMLGDMSGGDIADDGGATTGGGGQDFVVPSALWAPQFNLPDPDSYYPRGTTIGDFDGDGFADLATFKTDASSSFPQPYLQIRYGGSRPADNLAAWIWTESGSRVVSAFASEDCPGESLTRQIEPLGDIDADGYSDFAVARDRCRGGETGVVLFYGGPNRPGAVARMSDLGVFLPSLPVDPAGRGGRPSVAGIGDFDGDGFDDFMLSQTGEINAERTNYVPGGAYLFYGRSERIMDRTPWLEADAHIIAPQTLEPFSTGDMNGDGLDDVIIGSRGGLRGSDLGYEEPRGFYWLPGRAERLSADLDLTGVEASTELEHVTSVGDLDGDGLQDIFLYSDSSTEHLVYGAPGVFDSGIDLSEAAAMFGVYPAGPRRTSVLPAGDLDGDGDHELIAVQSLGSGAQLVALLSGSAARLSGSVELPKPSNPYRGFEDMFVEDAFPVGDLDGDGAAELATRSGFYPGDPSGYEPAELAAPYDHKVLNIHYGIPGGELAEPR